MSATSKITSSIIQQRLEAIVAEMGEAMLKTAYSQILNSSRDFSTAICDNDSRLIAQADYLPVHVGALPFAVRQIIETFGDDIAAGDIFLLNDPYFGGNHLPDLTAFVPVFAEGDDTVSFWTINRSHQSDIGGSTHGSYNPSASEIWQEGIRIPPLRLYERGQLRKDVLQLLATNVRHSRDFQGDLNAMIGSVRAGERRLVRLIREYGREVMATAVEDILDSADLRARSCVSAWKDGEFEGESILDDDGHGQTGIRIHAFVKKTGDRLFVDLSQTDDQVTGFINSAYANTVSSVHMALAFMIDPNIPKNEGTFRLVTIKTREGSLVHPFAPAPVTLSTNHPAQEIAEAIIKALAGACPDRVFAGCGRRFRIALKGNNPRTDKQFIWHMFHARPGSGASAQAQGWSGCTELSSAGALKFGSIEVAENRFPFLFEEHEFRPDSAGRGRNRGGCGSILKLRIETEDEVIANTAGDGIVTGGYGIMGGEDGMPHSYHLVAAHSGERRFLKTKEVGIRIRGGDVLEILSAGGGGYGSAAAQCPEEQERDIRDQLAAR